MKGETPSQSGAAPSRFHAGAMLRQAAAYVAIGACVAFGATIGLHYAKVTLLGVCTSYLHIGVFRE